MTKTGANTTTPGDHDPSSRATAATAAMAAITVPTRITLTPMYARTFDLIKHVLGIVGVYPLFGVVNVLAHRAISSLDANANVNAGSGVVEAAALRAVTEYVESEDVRVAFADALLAHVTNDLVSLTNKALFTHVGEPSHEMHVRVLYAHGVLIQALTTFVMQGNKHRVATANQKRFLAPGYTPTPQKQDDHRVKFGQIILRKYRPRTYDFYSDARGISAREVLLDTIETALVLHNLGVTTWSAAVVRIVVRFAEFRAHICQAKGTDDKNPRNGASHDNPSVMRARFAKILAPFGARPVQAYTTRLALNADANDDDVAAAAAAAPAASTVDGDDDDGDDGDEPASKKMCVRPSEDDDEDDGCGGCDGA